jgi:hypothetical protein
MMAARDGAPGAARSTSEATVTLFDDMVADAEDELLDLDAARAEIWVSAVFGTWRQPGTADDLAPEDVDHLLLDHLAAHPSRGALALALATEAIAPPAFAASAAAVAETLRGAGIEPPDWAPVAGSAHAVGAWSLQDPHGGSESLVIGFEHADGVRHALMVEIDHADGGMAVDLLFSPGELLDAIVEGPDPTLRTTALRPEEAARRAVTALDATREHPDPVVTDEFLMNWYLADTRLRRLAGLEPTTRTAPTTQTATRSTRTNAQRRTGSRPRCSGPPCGASSPRPHRPTRWGTRPDVCVPPWSTTLTPRSCSRPPVWRTLPASTIARCSWQPQGHWFAPARCGPSPRSRVASSARSSGPTGWVSWSSSPGRAPAPTRIPPGSSGSSTAVPRSVAASPSATPRA